jgi:hypothetical protein
MSRAKIGAVVVVVVAALTAVAYLLTTKRLESQARKDVEARVSRAQQLVIRSAVVDASDLDDKVSRLAADPLFQDMATAEVPAKKQELARVAFADFVKVQTVKPDFIAVTDAEGWVIEMDPPLPDRENWKQQFPAVAQALDKSVAKRDIWDYRNAVYKVGVRPFVAADGRALGAVVLGYALNASQAQLQADLLVADVAYFFNNRVRATSYRRKGAEEDVGKLTDILTKHELSKVSVENKATPLVRVNLHGEDFVVGAAHLPYGNNTSGALVMMSLEKALAPLAVVKTTILLLGVGAILVAILAMLITARLILNPAEEIELGVTEIINGNLDYTFKPAGADFDGLANALNVMVARLTGRPEPGDDELGEERAPLSSQVLLDDADAPATAAQGGRATAADPETVALAQEPEAEYYKRLFSEYIAARKAAGEKSDGVSFEGFVAKLRISEGNLKKKYGCKAVRFRVATKDGQVTLKPVPIL